ncbi:MAG TPA: M13 family metallopeptidase [Pyrinomonadaceae bacterium]
MRNATFSVFGTPLLTIFLCLTTLAQSLGVSMKDETCQPCDDFYRYANGSWMKNNSIPATDSNWSRSAEIRQRTQLLLKGILEEAAKKTDAPQGSAEQLIGAYYAACMDEMKIEAGGAKALEPHLRRIEKIKTVDDLQTEAANLHRLRIPAVFGFGWNFDVKDGSTIIGEVKQGQGVWTLPSRDYYTEAKFAPVREDFVKYAAAMFALLGDAPGTTAANARTILSVQTKLAESASTPLQLRDLNANYNKRTTAQLKELAPNVNWAKYFAERGAPPMSEVNVAQPAFIEKVNALLVWVPIADWKTYLRWQLVHNVAARLSSPFAKTHFDLYASKLTGQKEQQTRWKRCVAETDGSLGDALGQLYVKKAFSEETKKRAEELIRNLRAAAHERLSTAQWMGDETRRQALAKLAALKQKIGAPDKWDSYPGLRMKPDRYLENTFRIAVYYQKDLKKIGKPADRSAWLSTAPTFNAYYFSGNNEIGFPAGTWQPPMFDPKAEDAVNYGAIGALIGHEITHAFDTKGSLFDHAGNMRNWWSDADRKSFNERAACVERQYSAFEVEKGLFVNGKLTITENVADLGGINMAYAAYLKSLEGKPKPPVIDGLTHEQRFFISYANRYAIIATAEYDRLLVATDTHSPNRFRVNGPLSNMPEFAAAFSCKTGDRMVRAASERCRVW